MKKVLIISYFFPPCGLTASQRPLGWAKYLSESGYYPIIITRHWNSELSTSEDIGADSGKELVHQKFNNYEVYYLPYRASLRDKIFHKHGNRKFVLLRKLLTLTELISQNFSNLFVPYSNLYQFSKKFLSENTDVQKVIITANPFLLFKFGFLLQKRFKIKWIADYRDDWNTSEINKSSGFSIVNNLLSKLESRSEKKWVGTASVTTTISDYYASKISEFLNKRSEVLLNGFIEDDFYNSETLRLFEDFTIVYNGTLYPTQKIELFLNAYKRFITANEKYRQNIKMLLPGLKFLPAEHKRVIDHLKGFEENIKTTDRISRKEIIQIQNKSHVLLMVAHENVKGIPSSKLYEYIAIGKPIIVCPSDRDIIENTVGSYNLGYICQSENDAFLALEKLFRKYLENTYQSLVADLNYQKQFSRKEQTQKLGGLLDQL